MVLAGSFVNRMLCDGILGSLGIFIVAWKHQYPESVAQLSGITSLAFAIAHFSGKSAIGWGRGKNPMGEQKC